ncbi:MAG: transglutaminase family protein, partial [Pseudomonadota bacterium]
MSINAAITHRTTYRYDRRINLGPQVIRLRPAPHARTPILSFSQNITPEPHFCNWQQDPFGNYLARIVFPEKVEHFEVVIDLIADMAAINPFDFFLEESAEKFPFEYAPALRAELAPYLKKEKQDAFFEEFLAIVPRDEQPSNDYLVAVNRLVHEAVAYTIRMEPGVQGPGETLDKGSGSCRDSAWLLCHVLRHLGLASRFVSGYLIQLTPDVKAVDGPSGPEADFTDLHAWTEVFMPGAGWVGLDPTSGLFAGEGHIPLAATPAPASAAPITGSLDACEVEFEHHMEVNRVREEPRVTYPFTDAHWQRIDTAGKKVDDLLSAGDVRLTMGGEPTFVSELDRDAEEWNADAVGPTKRAYADKFIRRLRDRFAPGGLLHYGQGKWYPGEQLPRWAFGLYWRKDGEPLWSDQALIAGESASGADMADAERFMGALTQAFNLAPETAELAWEDPATYVFQEGRLPVNLDPATNKLDDPLERRQLAQTFDRGLGTPTCIVLPIQLAQSQAALRAMPRRRHRWATEKWKTRRGKLFLAPGDSAAGYRLPLTSLPFLTEAEYPFIVQRDPFAERGPLPRRSLRMQRPGSEPVPGGGLPISGPEPDAVLMHVETGEVIEDWDHEVPPPASYVWVSATGAGAGFDPMRAIFTESVRTAITVEPRQGKLSIFLPPVPHAEAYIDLIGAIEEAAQETGLPVHIDGYAPPHDPRINVIKATPDPGVIEVNIHPASSWTEQCEVTEALYEEARHCKLDTIKFMHDGRMVGSGGGNHIVVGGAS